MPVEGAITVTLVSELVDGATVSCPILPDVVSVVFEREVMGGTLDVVYKLLSVTTRDAEGLPSAKLVDSDCCAVVVTSNTDKCVVVIGAAELDTELVETASEVIELASVQLKVADGPSTIDVPTSASEVLVCPSVVDTSDTDKLVMVIDAAELDTKLEETMSEVIESMSVQLEVADGPSTTVLSTTASEVLLVTLPNISASVLNSIVV